MIYFIMHGPFIDGNMCYPIKQGISLSVIYCSTTGSPPGRHKSYTKDKRLHLLDESVSCRSSQERSGRTSQESLEEKRERKGDMEAIGRGYELYSMDSSLVGLSNASAPTVGLDAVFLSGCYISMTFIHIADELLAA